MVGFRLCRALLDAVGDGLSRFTANASHPSKPFDWKIPPLVRRTAPLLAPASHPGFEFKNGVAAGVHANNGPICRHAARFFFGRQHTWKERQPWKDRGLSRANCIACWLTRCFTIGKAPRTCSRHAAHTLMLTTVGSGATSTSRFGFRHSKKHLTTTARKN